MSKAIVSVKKFNPSNITFTEPRKLDSGGKSVYMNYSYDENTRKNLTIQVGSLRLPFNMSVYDKAGPDNLKYSMNLSLAGYDDPENDKVRSIFKMLTALDEYMIDQGVANSKVWFKGAQTRDVVKAFYTPIVQWPKDQEGNKKSFPPTIKLQLRQKKAAPGSDAPAAEGKFDLELYNEDGEEMRGIPLQEVLIKGSQVTCLMQCTGVWFAGSKFGLSWKAVQIRVDKMPDTISGYSFQAEDDEEAAPVVTSSSRRPQAPAPAPAPVNQNKFAAFEAQEEDEEEEEDEDFRPAAKSSVVAAVMPQAPAPAPVADDNAEDVGPIAVPGRKTVVTKKSVVKTAGKKA